MSKRTRTERMPESSQTRRRAPLAVRIIIGVLAVLSLAVTVLAGINIAAQRQYDAATQALQENIAKASKDDADFKKLLSSQRSVNEQFTKVSAQSHILLPQINEAVDHNAQVSSQLTAKLQDQIDSTQAQQNSDDTTKQQPKSLSSLNDEQRQQVEDMLKSNEELGKDQESSSANDQNNSTDNKRQSSSSVKPW